MSRGIQKKGSFLARARTLYAWGYARADIERMLGLKHRTLYGWQRQDREAGLDWNDLRAEARRINPRVLVATLERRVQEAAESEDLTPNQRADAVHKLSLVLYAERELLARLEGIEQ